MIIRRRRPEWDSDRHALVTAVRRPRGRVRRRGGRGASGRGGWPHPPGGCRTAARRPSASRSGRCS